MSHITRMTLTRFRSYEALRLDADATPVVLTGANGAGKTNLLEAVSLLSPGRGLRGAKISEMMRVPKKEEGATGSWGVAALVETKTGTRRIGTGGRAEEGERRAVRIDETARAQSALAEAVAISWLTPAMDRLFVEPAGARRRFLDRLVYGFDPAHAARVQRYEQAVRERAKLLELGQHRAWLTGIETVLAETGIAVAAARLALVHHLDAVCAANTDSFFPAPGLALEGDIIGALKEHPALTVEEQYRRSLFENRVTDAAAGRLTHAAHRNDLIVTYKEKQIPAALCSTGEQKALLISLILAHAALVEGRRGEKPILLLDEITAHLDEARRDALLDRLAALGIQAWLSGTDAGAFSVLREKAQFFTVNNGSLQPN
jgi:DNA replication and repair protein RecF